MANREKKDNGRDKVERIAHCSTYQPLPQIRNFLIVVTVGGPREGRQVRRRLGPDGAAQGYREDADQNQAQTDPCPVAFHGRILVIRVPEREKFEALTLQPCQDVARAA